MIRLLAKAIVIAFLPAVAIAFIMPALAAPPPFTCPAHTVCQFQHTDWTGTVFEYDASQNSNQDVWLQAVEKGSANVNLQASSVEYWNAATNAHTCVNPGRVVLNNAYGYLYIDHNALNCANVPPGP